MAKFDFKGAREAGYTDAEIASHLAESTPDFDLMGAVAAGYSPEEAYEHHQVTASEKRQPNRVKSLASAYGKGVVEGANEMHPGNYGPISQEMGSKVLNKLFPHQEKTAEKLLHRAGELTPLVALGGGSAGMQALELGSGVMGGYLAEQGGAGEVGQMVGELGGFTIPGLMRGVGLKGVKAIGSKVLNPIKTGKELAAKGLAAGVKFSGPEKLKLQQDLIKQFREAGIQADIGSITGSNLVKAMQARLSQSSLVGGELDKFRQQLTEQVTKEYGKLAEGIGEAKFANFQDAGTAMKEAITQARDVDLGKAREMYKDVRAAGKGKFLTTETPKIAEKIQALETEMAPGAIKSPESQKVLNELEKLKTDLFDAEGNMKPMAVSAALNNKINLADIVDYEVQGGAKNLLKGIIKDLDTALIEYGGQDPAFLKKYLGANKRFAEHAQTFRNKNISSILKGQDPAALMGRMNNTQGIRDIKRSLSGSIEGQKIFNELKRAKFDDIVMKNMVDSATNELKIGKFSNVLEKGKNRDVVRELLGRDNFGRLEKLMGSTGKLAESAYKYFNASKSGSVAIDAAAGTKLLFDLFSALAGNPWPLVKSGGGLVGARGVVKMITDPVFLKSVEDAILAKGGSAKSKDLFNYVSRQLIDATGDEHFSRLGEGKDFGRIAKSASAEVGNAKQTSELGKRVFEVNPQYYEAPGKEWLEEAGLNEKPRRFKIQETGSPIREDIKLSPREEKFYRREWDRYMNPKLFDKMYNGSEEKVVEVGKLGDLIEGKKARKLLKDVLDLPVYSDPHQQRGVGGTYNTQFKQIKINPKTSPADALSTIYHEAWHGVQDFHGKLKKYPFPKDPFLPPYIAYLKRGEEVNARRFERWATKDVQDYRNSVGKVRSLAEDKGVAKYDWSGPDVYEP